MSRFAECSNEDIDNLLKAIEQSWRVSVFYCREKSVDLNIETLTKVEFLWLA